MKSITTEIGAAPFLASLAAGPIFIFSAGVINGGLTPSSPIIVTPEGIALFFMMIIWTAPIGSMIAVLPNLIGTSVMAQLGRVSEKSRSPIVWAAVGFGAVALPVWGLGGFDHHDSPLGLAFAITGGACAVICHSRTRWIVDEDSDTAPSKNTNVTLRARDPDPRLLR